MIDKSGNKPNGDLRHWIEQTTNFTIAGLITVAFGLTVWIWNDKQTESRAKYQQVESSIREVKEDLRTEINSLKSIMENHRESGGHKGMEIRMHAVELRLKQLSGDR